jgi:hypothetical protein
VRLINSHHLGHLLLWLVNEKQLFIGEKQSFLVTGSLAGHSENVKFNQAQRRFTIFFCRSLSKKDFKGQFTAAVGLLMLDSKTRLTLPTC